LDQSSEGYQIMTDYVDAVLLAAEEAAKHNPPIHVSAQREFVDTIREMKAAGEFTQHPDGPVTGKGETVAEVLARTLKAKPHYLLLGTELDRATEAWTGTSLKLRGERIIEIGEKAAVAEAALYGIKPWSKEAGKLPEATIDANGKISIPQGASTNPFSPHWRGADRNAAITNIIKTMGSAGAARMAKAAGTDIAGRPLKS
jgi:hypothetical protein